MTTKTTMIPPRKTPERDEKYMGLAWTVAGFSKDPQTQVGAFLLDPKTNTPLGFGYNGPPSVINDDSFSWDRPTKYDYIIHAEENAIDHSHGSLVGATLYVTHMPCKSCILRIIKKGISRVVYMNCVTDPKSSLNNPDFIQKVREIASEGGVELEEFEGSIAWLPDWNLELKDLGVFQIS